MPELAPVTRIAPADAALAGVGNKADAATAADPAAPCCSHSRRGPISRRPSAADDIDVTRYLLAKEHDGLRGRLWTAREQADQQQVAPKSSLVTRIGSAGVTRGIATGASRVTPRFGLLRTFDTRTLALPKNRAGGARR